MQRDLRRHRHERTPSAVTSGTHDHRQRNLVCCSDACRDATLADFGHDERLAWRRPIHCLAGGAGECCVFSAECRLALVSFSARSITMASATLPKTSPSPIATLHPASFALVMATG